MDPAGEFLREFVFPRRCSLDAESVGTLAQGQSAMPLPPWLLLFAAVLPTHFVAGLDNGECDVDRGCRRALPASA